MNAAISAKLTECSSEKASFPLQVRKRVLVPKKYLFKEELHRFYQHKLLRTRKGLHGELLQIWPFSNEHVTTVFCLYCKVGLLLNFPSLHLENVTNDENRREMKRFSENSARISLHFFLRRIYFGSSKILFAVFRIFAPCLFPNEVD